MMPDNIFLVIIIYFAAVSLAAAGMTVYDKRAAVRGAWRVKERTLLLAAAFGGAAAMYVTMRFIRHKTKHMKFMVGIPVIIILQIAAAVFIRRLQNGGAL